MNKVILYGRTTQDIKLYYTTNNKAYIQFTIAVDNGKDANGEKREADFVNCVAWEKRAEAIAKYVKKGNRFAVIGSFKTDKYQDSDGNNRYRSYVLVNEYEFIETKEKDNFVPNEPDILNEQEVVEEEDPFKSFGEEVELSDDELPWN